MKFTVSIPVKPYVKRYLEINYGSPVSFITDPRANEMFKRMLHKPCAHYERKYPNELVSHTGKVEVLITERDFYRYGWELTKTDVVAFGKHFENRAKNFMRSVVGVYHSLGLPINISILRFQQQFQFEEEFWSYESIKKDFYRNGLKERMDFDNEIFNKIEKIIMRNLSDLGTITTKAIKTYENN